jgi:hypothetical protein
VSEPVSAELEVEVANVFAVTILEVAVDTGDVALVVSHAWLVQLRRVIRGSISSESGKTDLGVAAGADCFDARAPRAMTVVGTSTYRTLELFCDS